MKNALNGSITKFTLPKSGLKSKVLEIVSPEKRTLSAGTSAEIPPAKMAIIPIK